MFQYLESLKQMVNENLKQCACSPSVEMQDVPPDLLSLENTEEPDPDVRNSQADQDKRWVHDIQFNTHFYSRRKGQDVRQVVYTSPLPRDTVLHK